MFNFDGIKKTPVSEAVANWMKKYGSNHVSLTKQWKEDVQMQEDYDLLTQQLAYNLVNSNSVAVRSRILGRLRIVRNKIENDSLVVETVEMPDVLL
jgi:uncharacterized protein YfaP (DUF2135 family)